jgi:hypothetical protein
VRGRRLLYEVDVARDAASADREEARIN